MPDWPIRYEDVLAARDRIAPYLAPTPLRSYPILDEMLDLKVLVKHENHQPTNAFKVRNALAAVTSLSETERKRGVVAATMGNYGQGLAWAGQVLGVKVTICVPQGVNADKMAAMRGFGAELVIEGQTYDDANAVMRRLVRERGLIPLHGVNRPAMPAGAGTITLEILDQFDSIGGRLDAMLIGVGGGSQAVGAMTVLQARRPQVKVIGVQAEGASAIHDAWQSGKPDVRKRPSTFAEGLATGQTYELTFNALRAGLADFVLVNDAELADALRLTLTATHNLVEPAGVAGIAAARKFKDRLRGQTVGVIFSGANIDSATLTRVLQGG